MTRVIGLISGTSVDGIDAALVDVEGQQWDLQVTLLASTTYAYDEPLRQQILQLSHGATQSLEAIAALDGAIATAFAKAALAIQVNQPAAQLIGSHGQTVYHRPPQGHDLGYTWQLGRGDSIAHQTRLPTVSNFRCGDIAAGGHGAPLVSALDVCLFSHPSYCRCVQNIGGIGNLTYLPPRMASWGKGVMGWDTGPGNVLIDLAVQYFSDGQLTFDNQGQWAAQGTPCQPLIEQWLCHPFFSQPPPKSTGRELFGQDYFYQCWQDAQAYGLGAADLIATLTDFTAQTIALSYRRFLPQLPHQVILCGGGSYNHYLRQRLALHLPQVQLLTSDELGLDSGAKEAIAFAVLAYWHQKGIPGNVPTVTGACQPVILGQLHPVYPQWTDTTVFP